MYHTKGHKWKRSFTKGNPFCSHDFQVESCKWAGGLLDFEDIVTNSCYAVFYIFPFDLPALRFIPLLGTLRSDDGDGNGNATKAIGLICKTTILHVHHAFLYISLHDYDVKMPNFTMYRASTQAMTKFPLSFWTWIWFLGFNFRRVRLHLTKLVIWTNRDEDWKNANSLFQRRFLCRRRPRILMSLLSAQSGLACYACCVLLLIFVKQSFIVYMMKETCTNVFWKRKCIVSKC